MTVATLHRVLGKVFALFFIFASITAIPLFWRKDGIYSEATKEFLVALHTWEAWAKYSGILLAAALLLMSVTGLMLTSRRKATDNGAQPENPRKDRS